MAQQHDLPPAFLRMWWRIPTWSRMLPAVVVGGGALASMALVSPSTPPSHETPNMAAPATPGMTIQAPVDSPADMTAADYSDISGTTASRAEAAVKLVSSATTTTATVAQPQPQQQPEPQAQPVQQVQLHQPQPRSNDIDGAVQTAPPCDSDSGADTTGVQLPPANLSGADLAGVQEAARAQLTDMTLPVADVTRVVSPFTSK